MNIIIEEVVSEFPVIITEEVVQITISDAISYFDLLEVSDTDFVGKDGYVPVVNEATGKLVLSPQSGGSGGGIPDAPNDSNSYVRSALSWVIGYSKTTIDNLLGDKVDKVTGKGLSTEDYTTTEKSKLESITEIFTTALKTTYDDASAWVTDVGLQLKIDFDSLIETGSRLITGAEITKLSNISGTNTGDNATNTTSNAYADEKVSNTITDGVTDKAPSENAVFDALALKKDTTIIFCSHNVQTLADNTTYYFGVPVGFGPTTSTNASRRFEAPFTGKIIDLYATCISQTVTSAEDVVMKIKNVTQNVEYTIGNVRYNNVAIKFIFNNLNIPVTKNDSLEIQIVVPALSSNGLNSGNYINVVFEKV